MKLTGSQALLKALLKEEVDMLFGYPGGAIMPTYDALYDMQEHLHHVLTRHEQGAAHAAVGYARASGKVGVCLATSGPGATNLITGITDAMMDSVPLVCITGQVAGKFLGTDAFQEADIVGISVPVTKWNYQITSASEVVEVMKKAFEVARTGRPGPVLVDITKDAQLECVEYLESCFTATTQPTELTPVDKQLLIKAAALLNNAQRPLVLIGHGVKIADAETELFDLVTKADLPVASTLLGLSCFPTKNKLNVGMLGMHGNYAANLLSNEADVILAVGMRFDDRVTGELSKYLTKTKVIHIDIDPSELNKVVKADVAINSDAKVALSVLTPLIVSRKHEQWHQEFAYLKQQEQTQVIDGNLNQKTGPIKMAEFVAMLSTKTNGDALVVTDVGQHQMVTARYYQFNQPKSHITSGGLGTMGFSLPAAIGAKLAADGRVVVSISGDGGFQMNIQELAVIAQENLNIKIVILNNGYLGMVRQWQELFFENRYAFTAITSPDLEMVAKGYGIKGERVEKRENLSQAVDRMLASDSAYLLEIFVEKEENVFPMMGPGAGVSETQLK